MDFNFRQYDPQLGRFLSIDPLADDMSQSHLSPYAAMANRPHQAIDPNGLKAYELVDLFIIRNHVENIDIYAENREEINAMLYRSKMQSAGIGSVAGKSESGNVYYFLPPIVNFAGTGGGGSNSSSSVGGEGQSNDGGQNEDPEKEGKFGTYKVWDRAGGYDKKLSKEEADLWYLWGNGQPIYVDNSYIDWSGLSIPKDKKTGDVFQSLLQVLLSGCHMKLLQHMEEHHLKLLIIIRLKFWINCIIMNTEVITQLKMCLEMELLGGEHQVMKHKESLT